MALPLWKNLSVIRKSVQAAAFAFLVFGAPLVGFYVADKVTAALPALACAYDSATADYCVLVPLQHQSTHRIGEALVGNRSLWSGLLTMGFTLTTFLLLFVVLNKAFCGWICPLGFFQELLATLGQKLGLRGSDSLPRRAVARIRPVKWVLLGLLVFGLPLLAGLGITLAGVANHSPFCSVCPSRFLTTLATGDLSQLYVDTSSAGLFFWSLLGAFLFGLILTLGMTVRQPFCRICPMLALHAVFRKVGLVRLVKSARPRCEKCGLCAKACPMDIREIHTEMERRDVLHADCTLCGRCVEFCPDKDVLQIRYAVFPVFRADPAYFKGRKQAQVGWERHTLADWWRRWRGAA